MKTTRIRIQGMRCSSCTAQVEKALKAVPGVVGATVRLGDDVVVEHESVDERRLLRAITEAGRYHATVV